MTNHGSLLARLLFRDGQVLVGVGILWVDLEGSFKILDCLCQLPPIGQGRPAGHKGLDTRGEYLQGLRVHFDGVLALPLLNQIDPVGHAGNAKLCSDDHNEFWKTRNPHVSIDQIRFCASLSCRYFFPVCG